MGSGLATGDLVVAIVRRPDPVPCPNCAVGEWDMCRNGKYTEWGIKEHHGYARERYRITPDFVVKVDPSLGDLGVLLEPTTVVAKAWDHIDRIGSRADLEPVPKVLVTGAGPIGLLAALLGVQRGLEVHVLDQVTEGLKPDLVAALGATYHHGSVSDAAVDADVVIECTGVGQLIFDVMDASATDGIVCLTGVSSGGRSLPSTPACSTGAWCSATTWCSVRSTPTVATTRREPRPWPRPTATGWPASSPAGCPSRRGSDAYQRQPGDVKVVLDVTDGADRPDSPA